jgi:DNA mismatch repair protein MutL
MITELQNKKIELLPEHIIDQIKAGEVLERPASLIKELIENSIDANSTEINIQIIDNGLELISIEDNGTGMNFENLPYAFLRHATSKIKKFEDLYSLHSYGFRGEALASIAASARVTCQSQPQDLSENGGKIIINGGLEELLVPMKNPKHGTSLFIKNLFFNTPARLKFIKSKTSEKIQLKKIIYSFLLSHPEINFSVKWDDKEKEIYKLKENKNYIARFSEIVFQKNKEESPILSAVTEYDGHRVTILFTLIPSKNSPNKHQYFFANDRLFYDKNLHQTIIRNTDSIWKYGESGHYAVFIQTPPEDIDVNVHPNKTQIKFSKNDVVYSLLVTAIKDAIKAYYGHRPTSTSGDISEDFTNENQTPSFISLEEDRYLSLQELKNKTFDSKPMHSFAPTQLIEKSSADFVDINGEFFIFKKSEKTFLASKKILFAHYIVDLCQMTLNKEESISPLLISEPFNCSEKIDASFEILKNLGFEFDRLNPQVIVLRTIPRAIHRNLITLTANILIEFLLNSKQSLFDEVKFFNYVRSTKFQFDVHKLDSNVIYSLFENKTSKLIELSVELTSKNLERLFHE